MNQNKTESKWEEEFLGLRRRGKLETGDKLIDFISRIEQEAYEKGKTETVDKMRRTLNQIKKDLRLSVRSLYSVEIIEEAFNKIENYDKNNSTLQ